jgi:hypothetical protein
VHRFELMYQIRAAFGLERVPAVPMQCNAKCNAIDVILWT